MQQPTESMLTAVNSVLGGIGQSPVQRLEYKNPEISYVVNIINEVLLDVLNEGWVFNREENYPLPPANETGTIFVPPNILRLDISQGQIYRTTDVVNRGGRLYDKLNKTYRFEKEILCDVVWNFTLDFIPMVFQRYITSRAAVRAGTQLVASPELTQLLASQEAYARAACMEYECNQGDYTFFGTPPGTAYRSYQPYRTLAR